MEERFIGKIAEDFKVFIESYEDAARYFHMTIDQKVKFFQTHFDDCAKQLYRKKVAHRHIKIFEGPCRIMRDLYSSVARQNSVRKSLRALRLIKVLPTKKCTIGKA